MSDYIAEIKNLMGQADSLSTTTPAQIIACLTFTLLCAAIIYCVYRFFYRGACYSENFAVLLVMVAVITAMIILTISSSISLSLGTIGALSIIRFRSAIKDPLDVGFLFWSVVVGLTTGAGMVPFAVIGSLFIAFLYVLMTLMRTSRGTYLLLVRYSDEAAEDVAKVVDDLGGKLKNKTVYKDETELTVQIRFKGTDTPFLTELQEMNGVSNAVLVEFTGE
ncbi:MAG: DUF4956 domain-containing protein [Lachnospiraceae bacterium]|nr:DUF4956 domain-containing protein [Lachnospiraceae bacterium]MBO4787677.1 DUF4956 domain-containing protein [Lachnospiraceae bacterium]MBQ2032547.1 DUF4956 domain-containing protein [Lachnospiraceae bacterium]MBQ2558406.1 DUF4956 domain-containing protein [Lachnospiraceae bacterium]MBQ3980222.1 DUF4956 domain-containing protein [Lachnospiraceae bacterium]